MLRRRNFSCLTLALSLLVSIQSLKAEDLRVGSATEADQAMWQAILKHADITPNFAQLSPNRKQRAFANGDLLLDCCVSPKEIASQQAVDTGFVSDPIRYVFAYLAISTERPLGIQNTMHLNDIKLALLKGYQYPNTQHFGETIETEDIATSLRLVVTGKADATIITRHQLMRIKKLRPELPVTLGPPLYSMPLVARVHPSRPDLLARLNAAIAAYQFEALGYESAIVANAISTSVYRDVWYAILDQAGIRPAFIDADPSHRRTLFVAGDMHLDCCPTYEWRKRPEEKAVQIFTEPIMTATAYLIIPEDRDKGDITAETLKNYRLAAIDGFSYTNSHLFGPVQYYATFTEALDATANGEADVTIMLSTEFYRRQIRRPRPLKLGAVHARSILRARVHKDWEELLPRLNTAIAKLKASGRIGSIVGQRVRKDRD